MNRTSWILFAIATALLVPVAAGAASPVLEPGLWEVTIKTEVRGATPTMTEQVCIGKDQPKVPVTPKGKKKDDCVVSGSLSGNQLRYQMKCGHKNAMSTAEFTYTGDRYEGVVTSKDDDTGEIRQIYTAKRIGACETP